MKRILLFGALFLAAIGGYAAPTVETKGDTLVITVNANGDLSSNNFTQEQLASTNVKLMTANGVKLSKDDFKAFFGNDWTTPPFSKITNLDMSLADLADDDVIRSLGSNSPKLNDGKQLGTLVLPECLTSTKFTFNDNQSKWTKVVFPNATKEANKATTVIEASVFGQDKWLQSLVIGTSVKSIGSQAFVGCDNLSEVEYLYGLTHISEQAFINCTGLTEVILPESLTEIGHGAFEHCTNLKTLRLPNSLKTIKQEAFAHTGLTTVVIPASVENIENNAFGDITGLTDVYVLGTNTKCANQAFQPTTYTYGAYSYSGTGTGETVTLNSFTTTTGFYTVLHYPKEAYEKYVNKYIRVLGTEEYKDSGYSQWDNKWVVDADGNKYPVKDFGNFDGKGGDYAGWWNFMLTAKQKQSYKDERLVDGKWYSVCFPFDLTEIQIKNAFGNAVEVCEFSEVNIGQDENNKKFITLKFNKPVAQMKAHHPYMIRPGLHGAKYNVIPDVTIDTDEAGYAAKLKSESVSHTLDGVVYTFIGNHTKDVKVPMYSYYYYSGNDARWPNAFYKAMHTDVKFTPHTAVVTLSKDNGVSGSAAKQNFFAKTFLNLDDNTVTGIDMTVSEDAAVGKASANCNVYSIYGLLVRRGSASLDGLPAGIYVVNGKKYIVK